MGVSWEKDAEKNTWNDNLMGDLVGHLNGHLNPYKVHDYPYHRKTMGVE